MTELRFVLTEAEWLYAGSGLRGYDVPYVASVGTDLGSPC